MPSFVRDNHAFRRPVIIYVHHEYLPLPYQCDSCAPKSHVLPLLIPGRKLSRWKFFAAATAAKGTSGISFPGGPKDTCRSCTSPVTSSYTKPCTKTSTGGVALSSVLREYALVRMLFLRNVLTACFTFSSTRARNPAEVWVSPLLRHGHRRKTDHRWRRVLP